MNYLKKCFWRKMVCVLGVVILFACESNDSKTTATREEDVGGEETSAGNSDSDSDADTDSDADSDSDADGDGEKNDNQQDDTVQTPGQCIVHGNTCACVEQTANNKRLPVDIIFAVDSSGSMQVARNKIQNGLGGLSKTIKEAGIDSHFVLLASTGGGGVLSIASLAFCVPEPLGSGECGGGRMGNAAGTPLGGPGKDSAVPELLHLNVSFGMTQAASALLNQYPAYKEVLREKAHKHFVAVEDNWTTLTPDDFQNRLSNFNPPINQGDWTFNAVHVIQENNDNYTNLVEATNGYEGRLNQAAAAFDELLAFIAENVVDNTPLECEWDIPEHPKGASFDKDAVNVKFTSSEGKEVEYKKVERKEKCGDRQGWFYDDEDNPKKILVCPATCKKIQKDTEGRIDIILGCATVVV